MMEEVLESVGQAQNIWSARLEYSFMNLQFSMFFKLRKEQPKLENCIVTIKGDCSFPNLGIQINDSIILIQEVFIVFHVAATVRFNEKMKSATTINVRSLKDAINLSKKMSKLKSFVYEFSAYSNYANNPIEEKFYEPPIDADKLLDLMDSMDEKLIDDITLQLLGLWPYTYLYTKSLVENIEVVICRTSSEFFIISIDKVSLHCFPKSTNSTDLDNVSTMYLQCLAELSNMLSRPVFGILDSDILDETKF
ncbi:hypothetical protein HZH68_013965 [Vespula germanica]|uniref:Fatty acyl-CoA reductase n=1 Tax=Vespula germanica TaxID=30212 RepID=A0A834MV16_VESGE|nr:hypothetical protein HZH68_013965 [Vespula germanica]